MDSDRKRRLKPVKDRESRNVLKIYTIRRGDKMETAKSLDMILVTNNIKEFERIDDLHMENWVE